MQGSVYPPNVTNTGHLLKKLTASLDYAALWKHRDSRLEFCCAGDICITTHITVGMKGQWQQRNTWACSLIGHMTKTTVFTWITKRKNYTVLEIFVHSLRFQLVCESLGKAFSPFKPAEQRRLVADSLTSPYQTYYPAGTLGAMLEHESGDTCMYGSVCRRDESLLFRVERRLTIYIYINISVTQRSIHSCVPSTVHGKLTVSADSCTGRMSLLAVSAAGSFAGTWWEDAPNQNTERGSHRAHDTHCDCFNLQRIKLKQLMDF